MHVCLQTASRCEAPYTPLGADPFVIGGKEKRQVRGRARNKVMSPCVNYPQACRKKAKKHLPDLLLINLSRREREEEETG